MADIASLEDQKKKFYQQRRDEAQRGAQAIQQEGESAINRRFSSLGMQGSGAAIAANIKNREVAEASRQKAMADISGQETQQNMAEAEQERSRQFASGEAQKGRDFQRGLSDQELALRRDMMAFDKESKLKGFDLAEKQFQLAKDSEEFNRRLAELAMGGQPSEDGGILGTGISEDDAKKQLLLTPILGSIGATQVKKSDRGGLGVEIGGWSF